MGFTHGSAFRRIGHERKREVGPGWRRVVLQVPLSYNRHQPNKPWGSRTPLMGVTNTAGCIYFNFPEKGAYWIDAVQVVEVDDFKTPESPAFAPASSVEMGWSVEESGVSRERPRFRVAAAHYGKDSTWNGTLHCRITDYFGNAVQYETFTLELEPEGRTTREVEVASDRLGSFRVDLSLVDEQGHGVAADTLSLVRARAGRGGDAIAVGASQSGNSHVNQPAVLARLGFRQTRFYNAVSWAEMEPEKGVKMPIHNHLDRLMGDSGLRAQFNLDKIPARILGDRARYACPMDALEGYKEYARWILREIRPWVSSVSFVNEPNAHFQSPTKHYGAYQRALYETVQDVARGVDVVGIQAGSGSQKGGLVNYTDKMLRAGLLELGESPVYLQRQTGLCLFCLWNFSLAGSFGAGGLPASSPTALTFVNRGQQKGDNQGDPEPQPRQHGPRAFARGHLPQPPPVQKQVHRNHGNEEIRDPCVEIPPIVPPESKDFQSAPAA
jgi:hypothetical protein